MRLADLRRLVTRAAGDVAAIAERDGGDPGARARRALVEEFETILRDTLAGLEHALDGGADPATPMGNDWAEPTMGEVVAFFRGELAALAGFDRDDVRTATLIHTWLRTYGTLREDMAAGTAQTAWPCPTSWIELRLFRLAWKGPQRVTDDAEYNRLNRLRWARRDAPNDWHEASAMGDTPAP